MVSDIFTCTTKLTPSNSKSRLIYNNIYIYIYINYVLKILMGLLDIIWKSV